MTVATPPLASFIVPADGPATIAKACYDAPSLTLFVIGADGNLYTFADVEPRHATNLLYGPAAGQFPSLVNTRWNFTVGPAPII